MQPYHYKITKSFFKYGITIPKEMISNFECGVSIMKGQSREVLLVFKKKSYKIRLSHVGGKEPNVYQMRWDQNHELLDELKKEFIQSYIAAFSQEIKAQRDNKYHITSFAGGNQEVVMIMPVSVERIEMETFIKVETPYDELFKQMIEKNVFDLLSTPDRAESFIQSSTVWYDISELKDHKDSNYVVYYLLDETDKKLYIGSAKTLGDRLKSVREQIPNWNKFRYDIIKPEYRLQLIALEYFSIMSFARIFNNAGNKRTLGITDLTLVNKDYRYYS